MPDYRLDGIQGIYETIKGQLTPELAKLFLFGARNRPHHAGTTRITFIPDDDEYSAGKTRRGQQEYREIFQVTKGATFEIIAPTHKAIDGAHGLLALFLSILNSCFATEAIPITGSWGQIEDQTVRGELYLLKVAFSAPIVETSPDQTNAVLLALVNEAPQTVEIAP